MVPAADLWLLPTPPPDASNPSCPAGQYSSLRSGPPRGPREQRTCGSTTQLSCEQGRVTVPSTHISVWAVARGCLHRGGSHAEAHVEAGVCLVPDPAGKGVLNHTFDYSVRGSLSYGSPPVTGRPSPGVLPGRSCPPRAGSALRTVVCKALAGLGAPSLTKSPGNAHTGPGPAAWAGPGVPPRFPGGPRSGQGPGARLSPLPVSPPSGIRLPAPQRNRCEPRCRDPAELVPPVTEAQPGHTEPAQPAVTWIAGVPRVKPGACTRCGTE